MFDLIQKISSIPCVNGSEYLLADFINEYFRERGFESSIDRLNNVIVYRKGATLPPKYVFFTPMDSPGYVCLYREDNFAYLTPTSAAVKDLKDVENVMDFAKNVYSVEKSKYDENAFSIQSTAVNLGDALSIATPLSETDEEFCGRFAARFVCIAILMKFAEQSVLRDAAFCFTSGFNTSFKTESAVMNRLKGKHAVLLGFAECENLEPILCVKDGKSFSSKDISDSFLNFCEKNDVSLTKKVFNKPVTSAERLFSPHTSSILTLAIPCRDSLKKSETVSKCIPTKALKALLSIEKI